MGDRKKNPDSHHILHTEIEGCSKYICGRSLDIAYIELSLIDRGLDVSTWMCVWRSEFKL